MWEMLTGAFIMCIGVIIGIASQRVSDDDA
jgi:hypothetical protein